MEGGGREGVEGGGREGGKEGMRNRGREGGREMMEGGGREGGQEIEERPLGILLQLSFLASCVSLFQSLSH